MEQPLFLFRAASARPITLASGSIPHTVAVLIQPCGGRSAGLQQAYSTKGQGGGAVCFCFEGQQYSSSGTAKERGWEEKEEKEGEGGKEDKEGKEKGKE